MKLGPRYKIARRLGSPIFEKTQTQKFALSLARKEKVGKRRPKPKSEFGTQLIEKQKAKFSYYLTEKQFRNYVKSALRSPDPTQALYQKLESRLDNVLFRAGFAKTRRLGRQMASHGHATVNGRKVTIPSIALKAGDVVGVRKGSVESPLFQEAFERMKGVSAPDWFALDVERREAQVKGVAKYDPALNNFDLRAVLEFYSR